MKNKDTKMEMVKYLIKGLPDFDPAHPNSPASFY